MQDSHIRGETVSWERGSKPNKRVRPPGSGPELSCGHFVQVETLPQPSSSQACGDP